MKRYFLFFFILDFCLIFRCNIVRAFTKGDLSFLPRYPLCREGQEGNLWQVFLDRHDGNRRQDCRRIHRTDRLANHIVELSRDTFGEVTAVRILLTGCSGLRARQDGSFFGRPLFRFCPRGFERTSESISMISVLNISPTVCLHRQALLPIAQSLKNSLLTCSIRWQDFRIFTVSSKVKMLEISNLDYSLCFP